MSNLSSVMLDQNQLTGTIPFSMFEGLGGSLEDLDLSRNQLVGKIPSSIARMTVLESLELESNRLTGKLPHAMNQMFPDVRLNLTDNL